jgi:predicted O-methyltransferase YrrM
MDTSLIFFRVATYLKYIFVSLNRKGHDIHSPFVFDIVSRVFRNKTDPAVVRNIEMLRAGLLKDKRVIEVTDLGACADNQTDNKRKVSSIARYSAVSGKYGMLLANMAAEFGSPLVVEFGTSLGISTMYLALSCGETPVFSMEGCPATAEIAGENFQKAGLKNIRLSVGPFEEKIPEIIERGISPGLVFIDGNHRKEPLLYYFKTMAGISDKNSVIIIDDINYSREMSEAWNEIKQNGKVSITIDIFRMGIVFFREGVVRKDYIIRY